MISTLADILDTLRLHEAERLRAHPVRHGPTIGDMYEGLTRELLGRAIPPGLELRIVKGFILKHDGTLTSQMDLMLVKGQGERVPYTDIHIWSMCDVLVVFEVKKSLAGGELGSALAKMWEVTDAARDFWREEPLGEGHAHYAEKAFARLTGFMVVDAELEALPKSLRVIHFSTMSEAVYPLRVIWGYEGYASETGLRRATERAMFGKLGLTGGRGYLSLPTLVACGRNMLVKTNGFPYYVPYNEPPGSWDVMASTSDNAARVLLELVWTRISTETRVKLAMDDTLDQEKMSLLFTLRYGLQRINGRGTTGFSVDSFATRPLPKKRAARTWTPTVSDETAAIVLLLAAGEGEVDLASPWSGEFIDTYGVSARTVVEQLVAQRILAWTDAARIRAAPIEDTSIVMTQDGRVVMSDNVDLLDLWLEKRGP